MKEISQRQKNPKICIIILFQLKEHSESCLFYEGKGRLNFAVNYKDHVQSTKKKISFSQFLLFALLGIFRVNQYKLTSHGNVWHLNTEGAPIAPECHCTVVGKEGCISRCHETRSNLPRVADSKKNRCLSRRKSDYLDHTATTLYVVPSEMTPRRRNREKICGQALEGKEIQ